MDILAVLSPAVAPTEGAPPPGAAPPEGDAFASLFAQAMGDLVPTLPVEPALALAPTAVVSLPISGPAPAVAPPDSPGTESPSFSAPPIEADSPAVPVEPDGATDSAPIRGSRPRPSIPEKPSGAAPPPPLEELPVTEKEAPTLAPNAPVAPLDLTSEAEAPEDAKQSAYPSETTPAQMLQAVLTVAPVALLAAPLAAPEGSATADRAPVDPKARLTADAVATGEAVREIAAPSNAGAAAPRLETAPDLGVVPKVVATVETTPASKAKPTVTEAATVAPAPKAPSAEPIAPENPKAGKVETKGGEAAVVAPTTAVGSDDASGDAPAHDAPSDSPTASAPVAAKSMAIAATERPEAGADRPAVDRHLVVRQVADQIESLIAARPKDGVTVHLEPRDLGTVTLVVKGLSNALDVQIAASDDRVRAGLDASRPELAQALAPRGIEIRELRVAPASASTANGAFAGNGSNAGGSPEGRAPRQSPTPLSPRALRAEAAAPRAARSGRGVDLLA